MKDQLGLYYYPYPGNKRVRMYVRGAGDDIEFRLWNQDDAKLWDDHGWVPYTAIRQAAGMYKGEAFDPRRAYDRDAAEALLRGD